MAYKVDPKKDFVVDFVERLHEELSYLAVICIMQDRRQCMPTWVIFLVDL